MCGVIVVDAESFRYTWHGRDAYIHDRCLRYHHNFALFYQLLGSNLFTHLLFTMLREASSETYGPRVYFPSYKFSIYNISFRSTIFAIFYFLIYKPKPKNIYFTVCLVSSISVSPTFASNYEGIDNTFIALGASCLIFCVDIRWFARCLLLDWYLGSQIEGNTYLYFAASPLPVQGKNQCKLKK